MTIISRRSFLEGTAATIGASLLHARRGLALGDDPHFFLLVVVSGGMDASYLFDARPWSHTQAGLIQNYLRKDPSQDAQVWTGAGGGHTLASVLTKPLHAYRDHFSVVNGVLMSTGFDGHDQNMNMLYTGSVTGGDTYLTSFNKSQRGAPLDYVALSAPSVAVTNDQRSVSLGAESAVEMIRAVRGAEGLATPTPTLAYLQSRLKARPAGGGLLAQGEAEMASGITGSLDLAQRLAQLEVSDGGADASMRLVHQFFLHDICCAATLGLTPSNEVDTHDAGTAQKQPQLFTEIVANLAGIFKYLAQTPFRPGAKQSLLDVTTVVVASEFTRTQRQLSAKIDATGTDHNPLGNSLLVAGKGIKGGLVVGATDLDQLDKTGKSYAGVSKAHLALDPDLIKRVGKPFDFKTGLPLAVTPETFDLAQYISIQSVVNTLYAVFGVDRRQYWTLGRNLPAARTLDQLRG